MRKKCMLFMKNKKLGGQTVVFQNPLNVAGSACVAGKKEGEGPYAKSFDYISEDVTFGEKTWEKAESRMQKDVLSRAVDKAGINLSALEYIFAGDLLNQCIGSSFGLRESNVPFFGLYGACSTMAESLGLASMVIDGGYAEYAAALTSSHFCTAERQYRMPLEYGGQRTPTAQWTVTGAGAIVLSDKNTPPYVTHFTTGRIVDLGVKDAANMGAAMAPAAYDTLSGFFRDTGLKPSDFDLILTGDLGLVGYNVVKDFFRRDGIDLGSNYSDCGIMIYDLKKQDMHAGASGCGCSAVMLAGHILNSMRAGTLNLVLFAATGALLSPVSTQQGESIPSICHAVCLSNTR